MVTKPRGSSPSSSPITRERRQAMASNTTKKEVETSGVASSVPKESNTARKNSAADMDDIKDEFDQLGRELNMDVTTSNAAWASYDAIRQNYTLEVRINIRDVYAWGYKQSVLIPEKYCMTVSLNKVTSNIFSLILG